MILDMLSCNILDDEVSASRCVSMMNEYMTKQFQLISYGYEDIDSLDLPENEKICIKKSLNPNISSIYRRYLGKDDLGRHYFENIFK